MSHFVIRDNPDVQRIDHPGAVIRRHVGPSDGFGALRLFDDVVLEPSARLSLEAYGGYDALVYQLEGESVVEVDGGQTVRLGRGQAARAWLADGAHGSVQNPRSTERARALVVCVVSPANPRRLIAEALLRQDEQGIAWIATHDGEASLEAAANLGESTRVGVGTIDPGVEVRVAPAVNRALLVMPIAGTCEVGPDLVNEGGDARCALDKGLTVQGVSRARIAVADVPLGFSQQIA